MNRGLVAYCAGLLLSALLPGPVLGQYIQPDPGGESCKVTEQCVKHEYTFVPGPDQFFHHWSVAGDEKLLSAPDQNPALACSAGFGKGRLTAHYYTFRKDKVCRETCPDTLWHALDYDLFKQFKAPDPITGPRCVQAGQVATFSVPPILTDWPHRRANIGTDSYFWTGFPAGSTLAFSGDSASVTVTLPAGLNESFTVGVQVGRCNAGVGDQTVTVAVDQPLATVVQPLCGGPTAGLTISTRPGVQYTVSLPAGWGFSNGSTGTLTGNGLPQNVYFFLTGAGNVAVTATGGCNGPQSTALLYTVTP